MTIALNLTEQEAQDIIDAASKLKDNPVLWLLSAKLDKLLIQERERQAEDAILEAEERVRSAWRTHLGTADYAGCQTCRTAWVEGNSASEVVARTCATGKKLYQEFMLTFGRTF